MTTPHPEGSAPVPPPAEVEPTPENWRFEVGRAGKQASRRGPERRPIYTAEDGVEVCGEDMAVDSVEVQGSLLVCDGMGGYAGGDVAARIIVRSGAEINDELHEAGQWHGTSHEGARENMRILARHANEKVAEAKKPGGALGEKQKAGGAIGFTQFFIDNEGRPCLAGVSVGDPTMALADRTTGEVIDLNQEETLGAVSARYGRTQGLPDNNYNLNDVAQATLTNAVDGKEPLRLDGSRSAIAAHGDNVVDFIDQVDNTFVVPLEPGHDYVLLNATDGTEYVFRDKTNFKERSADFSEPGNIVPELRRALTEEGASASHIAQAVESLAEGAPKDDDQLIKVVTFTAPTPGSTESANASAEAGAQKEAAHERLQERLGALPEHVPERAAEFAQGTGLAIAEGHPEHAFAIMAAEVDDYMAEIRKAGGADKLPPEMFEAFSAMAPMMYALLERVDQSDMDFPAYNELSQKFLGVLNVFEPEAAARAQHFRDNPDRREEIVRTLLQSGDFMTLLELYPDFSKDDQNFFYDTFTRTMEGPILANMPEKQAAERRRSQRRNVLGVMASGIAAGYKGTKRGLSAVYLRPAMAGQSAFERLRGGRAMTFVPLAFLVAAGANYAAHKFGFDLMPGGGGGGAHAAVPGHETVGVAPPEATGNIDLGQNHALHLPEGYTAHDTGQGIEIYHNNQHVANLDVHLNSDGQLSGAEQRALTEQFHAAGINVDINETMAAGPEHAKAIDINERHWLDNGTAAADGNERGMDVTRLSGDRIAIDISGMDQVSHGGGISVDPQHDKMHALITDSQGHTFELPVDSNGRVVVDANSDIGRMLDSGDYHKLEAVHLDGHTANVVSTDFGHGGGDLPDNPTTGNEVQTGTGEYDVKVTADNSHPLTEPATGQPTTPPPTQETQEAANNTGFGRDDVLVGTAAAGATGAGTGVLLAARQERRAKEQKREADTAAKERLEQTKAALPKEITQAKAQLQSQIERGELLDTDAIVNNLGPALNSAVENGMQPEEILEVLKESFGDRFPVLFDLGESGALSFRILSYGDMPQYNEWLQGERQLDRVAEALNVVESYSGNPFDTHEPRDQNRFLQTIYDVEGEARLHEVLRALRFVPDRALTESAEGGRRRFSIAPGLEQSFGEELDKLRRRYQANH